MHGYRFPPPSVPSSSGTAGQPISNCLSRQSWRADYGGACELYTFGSPRVGNDVFALFVSEQAGHEYRVTHVDDPVPRLPSHLLGYYHTDMEYWLSTGTGTTTNYTVADVIVCEGIYNDTCNSGGVVSVDEEAHVNYFVHISACA